MNVSLDGLPSGAWVIAQVVDSDIASIEKLSTLRKCTK